MSDLGANVPESDAGRLMSCAHRGLSTSLNALATLSWESSIDKSAAFLIMLGTGDIRAGTNPVTFRRSLEAVIQQLRFRGVERVRLATPVASPFHDGRLGTFEE
ncbi:hypothetical protein ACFL01_04105, partial [Planctomycetota bacterium]